MAEKSITVDRLQVKRSKVAGRRPASLDDGEEFINHADGIRLIGDGVTEARFLPAFPLLPDVDDVPGLLDALSGRLATSVAASFAGAVLRPVTDTLFATVHAVIFGVEAIAADAPVEQRMSQTQKFRAAIAFAESRGAHLVLPQGDIWIGPSPDDSDACLRMQRTMGLSGAGWGTRLMPLATVTGRHILMIKPLAGVPMEGAFLRDFTICQVGAGHVGRQSLRIETTNAGGYIANLMIERLALGPGGPDNRAFWHFNTDAANKNGGMFASTIRNCTIVGGMKGTKSGDSNNIIECRISNFGIGIDWETTSGAAMQRIEGNNITSKGGAIRLSGALQSMVIRNQIEQSAAYEGDATNDNACIVLIGSPQSVIGNNNINTHGRCDAIAVIGSPDTQIEPNTVCYADTNFMARLVGSSGCRIDRQTRDITFVIGQDNYGNARKLPLLSIDTPSHPVVGVPMPITLQNGFTDAGGVNFNSGLRAMLLPDTSVRLAGNIQAGNSRAAGTVIATLPDAMRPVKAVRIKCASLSDDFGTGFLTVDTVGRILITKVPATGALYFDDASYFIQ